jgi:hypothetical protein
MMAQINSMSASLHRRIMQYQVSWPTERYSIIHAVTGASLERNCARLAVLDDGGAVAMRRNTELADESAGHMTWRDDC